MNATPNVEKISLSHKILHILSCSLISVYNVYKTLQGTTLSVFDQLVIHFILELHKLLAMTCVVEPK